MVASFGAHAGTTVSQARAVRAVPAMAETELRNGAEMQGALCVAERERRDLQRSLRPRLRAWRLRTGRFPVVRKLAPRQERW